MHKSWTTTGAQVSALATAVANVFAASNLTTEERNPERIAITDFAWQAPPLITDLTLQGIPLQGYLDVPIALEEQKLVGFLEQTLKIMHDTPHRLMRLQGGGLATCSWAMPKVRPGQRMFRFSRPEGWPGQMPDHVGFIFALEVAHAASVSLPVELVSDDSNYYVTLSTGEKLGVKDGAITCRSDWAFTAPGHVQAYLMMGRGEMEYAPMFDQLAALRSVLHSHAASFPNDFEAMDVALQALRYLSPSGFCAELQSRMRVAPADRTAMKMYERSMREALEIFAIRDMSDRRKLQTLHNTLVPAVITGSVFKKNIFASTHFPFTAAPGKMEKIESWLREEYRAKIPNDLKQLKDD